MGHLGLTTGHRDLKDLLDQRDLRDLNDRLDLRDKSNQTLDVNITMGQVLLDLRDLMGLLDLM